MARWLHGSVCRGPTAGDLTALQVMISADVPDIIFSAHSLYHLLRSLVAVSKLPCVWKMVSLH